MTMDEIVEGMLNGFPLLAAMLALGGYTEWEVAGLSSEYQSTVVAVPHPGLETIAAIEQCETYLPYVSIFDRGELHQRPVFRYALRLSSVGRGRRAIEAALILVEWMCDSLWNGMPADQNSDRCEAALGLKFAVDDRSVYAQIDRALDLNYRWRSVVHSSPQAWGPEELLEDVVVSKGIGGTDIVIAGRDLFANWIELPTIQLHSPINDPRWAAVRKQGFRRPVLRTRNHFILCDDHCEPGHAYVLNSKTFVLAFKMGLKFKTGSLAHGGLRSSLAVMLVNNNPAGNVKYTALTAPKRPEAVTPWPQMSAAPFGFLPPATETPPAPAS
jgi:hypothetical protein